MSAKSHQHSATEDSSAKEGRSIEQLTSRIANLLSFTLTNEEPTVPDRTNKVEVPEEPNTAKLLEKKQVDDPQPIEPQTEGHLPRNCLRQVRKLFSSADRTQYIKVVDSVSEGSLPYSGRFQAGGVEWKLHGESGLLTSTNRYVAQVSIEPLEELDRTTTFEEAKQIVQERLKVVRVLLDEQTQETENAKKRFEEYLESGLVDTFEDLQNAEDLFQLERILMKGDSNCKRIATAIEKNTFMSVRATQIICDYFEIEAKHVARSTVFTKIRPLLGGTHNCVDGLKKSVLEGIRNHKAKALEMSPAVLKSQLRKVPDKNVMFITKQDVKLFVDLQNIMEETVMKDMLQAAMAR